MALTYTLKSAAYDGRLLTLTCVQIPNSGNGTSTINWTLTSSGGSVNFYSTGPTTVKINGQQVYYKARTSYKTQQFPAAKGSVSGSIIVKHNSLGDYTVPLSLSTAIYDSTVKTVSASWKLDSLIALPEITMTDCYVGGSASLATKHYTHSVSIQTQLKMVCGDVEENLGMFYYNNVLFFDIPTKFASVFNGKSSITASIIAETTFGQSVLGTTKTDFTLYAQAKDAPPSIRFFIYDTNNTVAALTGGGPVIKGLSSLFYEIEEATAFGGATIKSYKVTNGSREMRTSSGTFENITTGSTYIEVTDSFGRTTKQVFHYPEVEYVPLTCNLKDNEIDTSGNFKLEIYGNYYNGIFGEFTKTQNTLKVEYRMRENNGEFGDWIAVTPTIVGQGYEVEINLTSLASDTMYSFQARATDKILTVESVSALLQANTIFDWNNEDFNFNVPIKLNNQIVLRHDIAANNMVLSGSGGLICFRPGGTDMTDTEMRITSQGNLEITGDIIIDGVSLRSRLGI